MLEELTADDLRQKLQEKEQTVATLTEYLEQAAVKLNTLQKKSSAEKPARAFDPEMVQRQMDLVEQLQAAVEEWDELNAPAAIEQLSGQLARLREIIVNGLAAQSTLQFPAGGKSNSPAEMAGGQGDSLPESESAKQKGDALEGWEALKAEMLEGEDDPDAVEEEPERIDLKEELEVLVNRPERVLPDCHDQNVWQEAVDAREKYTISLIRALRVVESRRRGSPDWDSLTDAPVGLRDEVAQLATDLQQTLRNAEVELSIERARISRQESLIAQQYREIEKAQKKQGYPNKSAPGMDGADQQQGRWLKFLGRNNPDEE